MINNEEEIICLKEFKYKDSDKILRVLSRNRGNIQLVAKGARRSKSKLLNMSQVLCYSKCQLSKNRDMYILSSGELVKNFYNISTNLDAFFASSYVLELVDYVSRQNELVNNLFDMTLKFFTIMDELSKFKTDEREFAVLVSMFEIKLVSMLGYKPMLHNCIACNKPISANSYMDINDGGLICDGCIKGYSKNYVQLLSRESILQLEKMILTKFENYKDLNEVDMKMRNFVRYYLHYHIGKSNFKSLDMFKKCEK